MAVTINGTTGLATDSTSAVVEAVSLNHPSSSTAAITMDASNNVGIGTSSPSDLLELSGDTAQPAIRLTDADVSGLYHRIFTPTNTGLAISADTGNVAADSFLRFDVDGSEAMRIDSSGNLLVGKTDTGVGNYGFAARGDTGGSVEMARDGGTVLYINRGTSDGVLVDARQGNSTKGYIGTEGGRLFIESAGSANLAGIGFSAGGAVSVQPRKNGTWADNAVDLGSGGYRWDDVYATNATIQTSDQNEKQDIEELSEAEKRVATAAKGLIRKFRWIDAVAEKGDDARIHVGVIAQDLQAAFEAEGLDAGRYAMFISSTLWEADEVIPAVAEELDEDGSVITEAQPERTVKRIYETVEEAPVGAVERTRLGVRYPELLAFIIGAL